MCGDVGAPVLGRFDGCAQFGLGEGGYIERAEWRGDATARRELDLRRALHELLAHAHANLIRTIRNHAAADLLHAGEQPSDGAR